MDKNTGATHFDKINMTTACDLLDKVTIRHLHLMEDKMRSELNIETSINNGSIHLAKTRYIMGQSSVSTTQLPVENSAEFSASTICETDSEHGVKQLKVAESTAKDTINPLHWFGVLVPQNLHKAQSIFQNTIKYVVECVNIQFQLYDNMKNIKMLQKFKQMNNS